MKVVAKLKHLHVAPRKARAVGDLIVGMNATSAMIELKTMNKNVAKPFAVLLKSAMANATNNSDLEEATLKVSEVRVDEGPVFKRWRPVSKGRAYSILKRTCHIQICLEGKEVAGKKSEKKDKVKFSKISTKEDISKTDSSDDQGGSKGKKFVSDKKATARGSDKGFLKQLFRRKSSQG